MIIFICLYLIASALAAHHYLNLYDGLVKFIPCVISGLLTPLLWFLSVLNFFTQFFGVAIVTQLGPMITQEEYIEFIAKQNEKNKNKPE